MSKQELVLRLNMGNNKQRAKALTCATKLLDIVSVSVEGDDKIRVVGKGIDAVELTRMMRKKMGSVELVTVTTAEE